MRGTEVTIEVVRSTPPEVSRCRAATCGKSIEWVHSVKNDRRMPVDHPLTVIRVYDRDGRAPISVISAASSHFVSCTEAAAFRRRRK